MKLLFIQFTKENTVEDYWQNFIKTIAPEVPVDSNQYRTMRLTFYSASACMFAHLEALAKEEDAASYLLRIPAEIEKYFSEGQSHSGN